MGYPVVAFEINDDNDDENELTFNVLLYCPTTTSSTISTNTTTADSTNTTISTNTSTTTTTIPKATTYLNEIFPKPTNNNLLFVKTLYKYI